MSSPVPIGGGDQGPDWENLLYTLVYLFGTGVVGAVVEWIRKRLISPKPPSNHPHRRAEDPEDEWDSDTEGEDAE